MFVSVQKLNVPERKVEHPSGSSSPGRATASQAVGSGFESRLPLFLFQNDVMEKKNFFVTLTPPRVTFPYDMSNDEREIMKRHVAYWHNLLDKGFAIAFGPVMDPNGPFGMAVVEVDSQDQVNEIVAGDPANVLHKFETFPMRVVYKKQV